MDLFGPNALIPDEQNIIFTMLKQFDTKNPQIKQFDTKNPQIQKIIFQSFQEKILFD